MTYNKKEGDNLSSSFFRYYISFSYNSSSLLLEKLNLKSISNLIFEKNVFIKLCEYILGRFKISFLALRANE